MIFLWLQSLVVLGIMFALGLLIGHIFGALIYKAFGPARAPKAFARELPIQALNQELELETLQDMNYHGYRPNTIKPIVESDDPPHHQLALDLGAPFREDSLPQPDADPTQEEAGAPKKPISLDFPVWSFGVVSETFKKSTPLMSPLAYLEPEILEEVIKSVAHPRAPMRAKLHDKAKGDDLLRIDGIDHVLLGELNDLGIFYFWQVASLTAEEVAYIAARIHFPDRIVRHHWIRQAKNLMEGAHSSAQAPIKWLASSDAEEEK